MDKVLVVVDAQMDFINGALRNEEAIKKVPNIENVIKKFDGKIIFTQDCHKDDYMQTLEGKKLPVKHCIIETDGMKVDDTLVNAALCKNDSDTEFIKKNTFGSVTILPRAIYETFGKDKNFEIYICGFCTDICVVSNALILRANYPNVRIVVLEDCCAGTSIESHNAAITVMKNCQIDIEYYPQRNF